MDVPFDGFDALFKGLVLIQDMAQDRIVDQLADAAGLQLLVTQIQMGLDVVNTHVLHGQVDHRVLQNRVLNARLAKLVAKLGILRDVQAAIVYQNGALGLFKLLFDVGHDALLDL